MFEPSAVRKGLDDLLAFYPFFDVISVEWQVTEHPLGFPIEWGPWVLVKLGQASEGETQAFAVWQFAIWRTTGAVHAMSEGAVSDDPIFPVP